MAWSYSIIKFLFIMFLDNGSGAATYRQPDRNPPEFPGLLNIDELAALGGYSATNYEVITEDGYSLWLFRIGNNTGPPVLMQHGLLVASDQWILRGTNRDLSFMLLDRGFDVWLSNQRGTVFNEYNVNYPKSDPKFWDFSFHESGYYDMPAFVDTVLELRGKKQLFFVGHSLGTTVFFVMCSTRPEYNDKIRAAVLLSPIGYVPTEEEQTTSIRLETQTSFLVYRTLTATGNYEVGPRTEESITFLRAFCTGDAPTRTICLDILGIFAGEHRANLDPQEFDFFIPYYGAGTSAMTLYHTFQQYQTGGFKQFDYGMIENLRRYGSVSPPDYRLRLVKAPVAMFWGYNDILTSETSVNRMASELPNLIFHRAVPDPKFDHIDMYLGDNTNRVLNPDVIAVFEKFSFKEELPPYNKKHYLKSKEESYSNNKEVQSTFSKGSTYGNTKHMSYPDIKEERYPSSKEELYRKTKQESYPDTKEEQHPSSEEKLFKNTKHELYPDNKEELYRETKPESYPDTKHELYPDKKEELYRKTKLDTYPGTKEERHPSSEEELYKNTKHELYPDNKEERYPDSEEKLYKNTKYVLYPDTKKELYINTKQESYPDIKEESYSDAKPESYPHAKDKRYPSTQE